MPPPPQKKTKKNTPFPFNVDTPHRPPDETDARPLENPKISPELPSAGKGDSASEVLY